ncbi:PIN domain-containing protein [Thermodesulfitimonas sp.]
MTGRVLVDTNVLVYAYDFSDPPKQERAFKLLDELANSGRGVLSAQVLAEFAVAVTQKIAAPLDPETAQKSIQNYLSSWTVLDVTGFVVLEAVRGVREHRFSYWNAQIWATARLNQIPVVLSEDFASGSAVEGVAFLNPFAAGFDLARLL